MKALISAGYYTDQQGTTLPPPPPSSFVETRCSPLNVEFSTCGPANFLVTNIDKGGNGQYLTIVTKVVDAAKYQT